MRRQSKRGRPPVIRQSTNKREFRWPIPARNCSSTASGGRPGRARAIEVINPATEEVDRHRRACREGRPRRGAGGRRRRASRPGARCPPSSAPSIMRKAAAILRERNDEIAPLLTQGGRQDAGRSQEGGDGGRRHHRLVRRGSEALLWPRHPGARPRHLPAGDQGAGRPGRGLHAVEFPDQPGGAQDVGGARRRLLDHRQGAGGNAGFARGADPRLRRCRHAGRRDQSGLRHAGGNLRIPDPASGDPQDLLHRLDRRSASNSRRSPACT